MDSRGSSQRLAHMTWANWFFVSLAAHARFSTLERDDRGTAGGGLRMWLGEAGAGEYYKSRLWYRDRHDALPNPEGLGTWTEHGREVTFVLVYDTGTENMSRLAAKLESYGNLADDPGSRGSLARAESKSLIGVLARRERSDRRPAGAAGEAASPVTSRRPCRVARSAAARPEIQPSRSWTEPTACCVSSGNISSTASSTARCRAASTGRRFAPGESATACRSAAPAASASRSPMRCAYEVRNDCRNERVRDRP
jgi:Replication-relaxation